MNLTRLMALGILARSGPSHGHHIRRVAELTDVSEWGGVSVGALYRELRAMEREGLVEATRTERVGNRPERTVYAITDEGQLELTTLREQAIKPLFSSHDRAGRAARRGPGGGPPAAETRAGVKGRGGGTSWRHPVRSIAILLELLEILLDKGGSPAAPEGADAGQEGTTIMAIIEARGL